jgi:uncharacterized protein (TIRG00374 family)
MPGGTSSAAELPNSAGWLRKHALALVLSLLVCAGFAWLLERGALPVVPPRSAWSAVSPWILVLYTLAFAGVHISRCARWRLLASHEERPSTGLTIAIGLVGYGAQVLLPFRLGEAVRPALMRSEAKLPLGTAAGVVGAERIIDGLVLSLCLLIALSLGQHITPLPDHIGELPIPAAIIPTLAWSAACAFGGLALAMLGVHWFEAPLARWIERTVGPRWPQLAAWAARTMTSVVRGFAFLRKLDTMPAFAGLTALYWSTTILTTWFLLWACGITHASLLEATVILGVLGLGVAVPNAPGFFGTFQISGYSALVLFYPQAQVTSAGAAFLFFMYVIQMLLTIAMAGGALLWVARARQQRSRGRS